MRRRQAAALLGAALLAGCGGAICDAGDLGSALGAAVAGDVVEIGACTIAGHFTVPPGVTLRGAGEAQSRLLSTGEEPVLDLSPGTPATRVEALSVDSAARFGVRARGLGEVQLQSVQVSASRGVAFGAEGLDRLSLSAVQLLGPVRTSSPAADAALFGLVLVSVAQADLQAVQADAFRRAGALLVRSQASWSGGGASRNLGSGLLVEGGGLSLAQVALDHTLSDNQRLRTWAGVFFAGATVESSMLSVRGSGGYGLLHHQTAEVRHAALLAEDNSDAAIWLEQVPAFELSGRLARNGFAGCSPFARPTSRSMIYRSVRPGPRPGCWSSAEHGAWATEYSWWRAPRRSTWRAWTSAPTSGPGC